MGLVTWGSAMMTLGDHRGGSAPAWLDPAEMEVIEDPSGLRVVFEVPQSFFAAPHAEKDCALAAAGAYLSAATIQTAAGWGSSARLISMTLEFLADPHEQPVIGTGTISHMGTNVAFVSGQIEAGGNLCLRCTGSGRIVTNGELRSNRNTRKKGI